MSECAQAEIVAYEQVRQRLRRLAVEHPWILDISIAAAERLCRYCHKNTCVEQPADHLRCTSCGAEWDTTPQHKQRRHTPLGSLR